MRAKYHRAARFTALYSLMRCGSLTERELPPEVSRKDAFAGRIKNVGGSLFVLLDVGRMCCEPRTGQV